MDDLDELRSILGSDPEPTPEASAPLDGAPQDELVATDPEEEGLPLSAEERVAALAAEAMGVADAPEESVEASADEAETENEDEEEDEDDIQVLLELGRQARARDAQAQAYAPYQAVYAQAESRVVTAKQHYAAERRRITRAVYDDAQLAHDPDAYISQHLDAAIDGVIAAEDAWITQVGSDARAAVQRIREEQSKPAWAAHLAAERHLPKEAIPRILAIGDPRQMPAIADLLVESRNAMATERRKRTLKDRERKAREIAANQVHASSTGRPAGARPIELTGSEDELVAILNMK